MSSTTDNKATKVAEIVRLQEAVAEMTKGREVGTIHHYPPYVELVDQYLTFLLHFVGTAGYEWTEARLARLDRLCEVTTNIRDPKVLAKIPEDMIPPVAVREMMIGDENGPWMIPTSSKVIQEFITKYPFLMERHPGA